MFGIFKQKREPSPREFGPLFAIADLMMGLTYAEMVELSNELEWLAIENQGQPMHVALSAWAKKKRPLILTTEEIADGTITASKIRIGETLKMQTVQEADPAILAREALDRARSASPGFGSQRQPPPPTLRATTDEQIKGQG